ncbi:MAG: CHASE2 domain-containing protein [Candidatus Xenobia bacterium]
MNQLQLRAGMLVMALVATLLGHLVATSSVGDNLEGRFIDGRFRARDNASFAFLGAYGPPPRDPNIVILGMDRQTYETLTDPTLMWNPYYAEVIEAITRGGARALGIDELQTVSLESVKPGGDVALSHAIASSPHVVLEYPIREVPGQPPDAGEPTYSIFSKVVGDANEGFNNLLVDADGIVRRQPLFRPLSQNGKTTLVPAFAMQLVRQYEGDAKLTIPWDRNYTIRINYVGPGHSFPYVSFLQARQMAEQHNDSFFADKFGGKIVLLGEVDNVVYADMAMTPYFGAQHQMTPGVEVHADIINTILTGRYLKSLSPLGLNLITFILALLVAVVVSVVANRWTIPALLGLLLAEAWLSAVLFTHGNLQLNMVEPLAASAMSGLAALVLRLLVVDRKANVVRGMFEKYVTPQVVQELMKHPDKMTLGGEEVEATVVFTDINSFTTISHELMDPVAIISFLNEYFAVMAEVVDRHRGTLQAFLGDGLQIIFNAPVRQPDHAQRACRMGLEMMEELDKLQKRREAQGKFVYWIKIGINTGKVVVGNLGSSSRMEYTSIGDTVNLSQRIMDATKVYHCDILCSKRTYELAHEEFEFVDHGGAKLDGADEPVPVYEVVRVKGDTRARPVVPEHAFGKTPSGHPG